MDPPSPTPIGLFALPGELLIEVASHLPGRDVKNLRLTCHAVGSLVRLRIDRVFLSANPLNVAVLKAIADNETYRHGVFELIWDDARLLEPPEAIPESAQEGDWDRFDERAKSWLDHRCGETAWEAHRRRGLDADRPDHTARRKWQAAQPPIDELWAYYKELIRQQNEVLHAGDDIAALEYGLRHFPSLRKITLTPAVHAAPFCPLYETPMIRAFPYGFNYPLVRGWPAGRQIEPISTIAHWESGSETWRGFCVLTSTLARVEHRISDFVVDVSLLNTGLNAHIFDQPCDEYKDFVTLLRTPGFRRLDLALLVNRPALTGWSAFRNDLLGRALGEATDLRHLCLSTNSRSWTDCDNRQEGTVENFIPLRPFLPLEKWPRLEHFGLSGFVVDLDDLISVLAALPATVRSVELSLLSFPEGLGTMGELLTAIRDTLNWRSRPAGDRPKLSMVWIEPYTTTSRGRAIWLDNEANDFVYGDRRNPFDADGMLEWGAGVVRDMFEPAYERPYVDALELLRLGIHRRVTLTEPVD